jgi:hypothetical protein
LVTPGSASIRAGVWPVGGGRLPAWTAIRLGGAAARIDPAQREEEPAIFRVFGLGKFGNSAV